MGTPPPAWRTPLRPAPDHPPAGAGHQNLQRRDQVAIVDVLPAWLVVMMEVFLGYVLLSIFATKMGQRGE